METRAGSIAVKVIDPPAGARELADEICERVARGPSFVLGLATGKTPVGLYGELAARRAAGVSFAGVTTFNLDELAGLGADDPRAFRCWTAELVHGPLGIPPQRAHSPDAPADPASAAAAAADYERRLAEAGGVDLQVLGLGRNGHIGFNEPGTPTDARTHLARLADATRRDAVATFGALADVPTHAVTMGLGTILEARAIRLLAFGAAKREAVARLLADEPDPTLPASVLRGHPDVRIWIDAEAAAGLHR